VNDAELLLRHLANEDSPCPACGYNLRDLTTSVCPECGKPLHWRMFIKEPSNKNWYDALYPAWLIGNAVLLGIGVAAGALINNYYARERAVVLTIIICTTLVPLVGLIMVRRRRTRMPRRRLMMLHAVFFSFPIALLLLVLFLIVFAMVA